jgi:hypothetical protein
MSRLKRSAVKKQAIMRAGTGGRRFTSLFLATQMERNHPSALFHMA